MNISYSGLRFGTITRLTGMTAAGTILPIKEIQQAEKEIEASPQKLSGLDIKLFPYKDYYYSLTDKHLKWEEPALKQAIDKGLWKI